jgi:rhamnosyltransferase
MRVACIIPTYNGIAQLGRLLDSIEHQTFDIDTLVVDSSSIDGTQEFVANRVKKTTVIPSSEFNHGGTRQWMVDQNPGYDVYIFLTQDAYLESPDSVAKLIEPFVDPKVAAVCGRQVPNLDATPLAKHARLYNYPDVMQIKTIDDISQLGIKAAFMSNSFSAYRAVALTSVGGFPKNVIFAEDMYVAAKMLLANWKLVYSGEAVCRHSHNYSYFEEFSRYFDMGVFHARESWIRRSFGGAGGEGLRYVKSELKFLGFRQFYLWPNSISRNFLKLIGYKLGQQEAYLPIELKLKISMNKNFWKNSNAKEN